MKKSRSRRRQTVSLQERLAQFSQAARKMAATLPAGPEKTRLLRQARDGDVAADFDRWIAPDPAR